MNHDTSHPAPGCWTEGPVPANVVLADGALVQGPNAFKRFKSTQPVGLRVGLRSVLDGVHVATGPQGRVEIANWSYLTNVVLLCDLHIRIGSYVRIGWNTTIADTDFHPMDPALRVQDAIECSPLGNINNRPRVACAEVVIEDDVWIGPQATILKGVRIGRGAFVEAGALVTRDVPSCARVIGNPARIVEPSGSEVSP